MELALHVADFTPFGPPAALAANLAAGVRAAEDAGFSTVTLMDHWFQMEAVAPAGDPMLDGYSALSFLAAHTSRIQLGLLVTGVTYRHPGLLAKTVATLDVLSGGRAMLGIGAAWYEREHRGLGVPFPPVAERFERLEETLQICRQMWSDDNGSYTGKHYSLAETLCEPRPLQQPRPPVLIGGMGEKKTLRLVAKYADACNLFDVGADGIARKLEVLAGHCRAEGRDIREIETTVITAVDPVADPDGFLATAEAYAALGVAKIWLSPKVPDLPRWIAAVGERLMVPVQAL